MREIREGGGAADLGQLPARAEELRAQTFDRAALAQRRLPCERLDQLVVELLMGV